MTVTESNTTEATAVPTRREIFKLFLNEKRDPEPYYDALADRTIQGMPFDAAGDLVLDLGSGTGHNSRALASAGANVVSLDLFSHRARESAETAASMGVAADGMHLPFADGSFEGLMCSNMLEHAPSAERVVDEIGRVLRPNGWAWVAFTNWWSPWGGHNITPYHLLGTKLGPRVHKKLKGDPPDNVPFEGLFPTYIGEMLRYVRSHPMLEVDDVLPRYYPGQRWILKVPVFREVATWNCLMLLRRRA